MAQGGLFPTTPEAEAIVGGKYRLIEKISEGGGGTVWKATDPAGKEIALKFLKWSPMRDRTELAEKFKNEFAILKSLSHPNISEIYDFGFDHQSQFYYFTSELITEGDLREMIGAPIPVIESLLLQALRALEYLRGNKLLHLDIKPHNLLLRHDGDDPDLALIDFGIATFRPPDRPGGTPNYMAPELISMRIASDNPLSFPKPDHRSDLYSLGVTFYYLLTGVRPFNVTTESGRADLMGTLRRHLEHRPPPPSHHRPEIPHYLDRIVMKLMAQHPDDRYPSAIVAAQAIQYSSPRKHAPECLRTLLSYLPKEGKLIGRHRESAIIEESIRAIAKGTAHVAPIVCIAGTRGTGRSRLLDAAKPIAQQHEMDVVCFNDDHPLSAAELLALTEEGTERASARTVLIDDLDRLLLEGEDGASDDSIAHAFEALLRRLRLQQRLPDAPLPRILLIFTLNKERRDPAHFLSDLELSSSTCHTITLGNFSTSELSEYLSSLLGETPHDAVILQLMQCTGGNPLFITEHLEQMISEGRLFSLAGRPDAETLAALGIDFAQASPPRSLKEIVIKTFEMLTPKAQDLAILLACWHRPASIDELIHSDDGAPIDTELLELIEAELVQRQEADGRIAFLSPLSPRIIRDHAPRDEIASCHDHILHFLKARKIRKPKELNIHLAYGSDASQRIPALQAIAEQSLEESKPLAASRHLEALLMLISPFDWRARADTLLLLGKAYERAHRYDDAKATYERISLMQAPERLSNELHILADEQLGRLAMRRRKLADARQFFLDAISIVNHTKGMTAWRLRLENNLASVALREGNVEDALLRFEQTAAVAQRALSEAEQSEVNNNELGEALIRTGAVERAVELLTHELEEAERFGDWERVANRHYLLGNALRSDRMRSYEEAQKHYRSGLRITKRYHLIEMQVRLQNGLGNLCFKIGRPKEAMAHYQEALKLAQQMESETTSVEIMIGMGLASQQIGAPDKVIEYFEAALEYSQTPKATAAGLIRRYRPSIFIGLADAYFQKGILQESEDYLRKALAIDQKHPLTPDLRYSLYGTIVEIAITRGDHETARHYMPTVEAIAKSFTPAQEHFAKLKEQMGEEQSLL